MSPVTLWLFFTLDRVIATFNSLFTASTTYIVVAFIVWVIGYAINWDDYDKEKKLSKIWSAGFKQATKPWTILAIVILPLSIVVTTFLPNTKEAVAIVVIPKVIKYASTNPEAIKIPNNIMKMANSFMEKKIEDWAKDLKVDSVFVSKDTTKTIQVDSTIADLQKKLDLAVKLKESFNK